MGKDEAIQLIEQVKDQLPSSPSLLSNRQLFTRRVKECIAKLQLALKEDW